MFAHVQNLLHYLDCNEPPPTDPSNSKLLPTNKRENYNKDLPVYIKLRYIFPQGSEYCPLFQQPL